MAEKDISEKTLEWYPDVFADIVNVLLFAGKQIVAEDDLTDATPDSAYKADDSSIHIQERDVSKYWKGGNIRIALYGLENQTKPENDMPLRVIGYDGASYRSQILEDVENQEGEKRVINRKRRYPVITLVLYFGYDRRWNKAKSLYDCMEISDELKPFVNDYKINLFEIAWLSDEQIGMFQSDFRIVADFFSQMQKNKDYCPSDMQIKHVREVLQLLSVFSSDERFIDAYRESKKGEISMCDIVDDFIKKGREESLLQSIQNLMETLKLTAEQAMEALKIPETDRSRYLTMLK